MYKELKPVKGLEIKNLQNTSPHRAYTDTKNINSLQTPAQRGHTHIIIHDMTSTNKHFYFKHKITYNTDD